MDKDLTKLNKWSAKKLGKRVYHGFDNGIYDDEDNEWNLEDARCMEIFREKFKVDTTFDFDGKLWWSCESGQSEHGETIKEAELACAWAIMETEICV
jgi:hypothetical protein